MGAIYKIEFTRDGQKDYDKYKKTKYAAAIEKAFEKIAESPLFLPGKKIEPLTPNSDTAENSFRCRVGDLRIVYTVFKKEIIVMVMKIEPRGQIYKK